MSRAIETGPIPINEIPREDIRVPRVTRNKHGQIAWQLHGNTPEQNELLGIRNVQALFLERYPEFDEVFPREEDGKITEDKRKKAKMFILERMSKSKQIKDCCGTSPTIRKNTPYFNGSNREIMIKAFSPWGISFEEIELYLTKNDSLDSVAIMPLSQMDGIRDLKDYFHGRKSFDELKPFLLKKASMDKKNKKLFFYVDYNHSGSIKDITLNLYDREAWEAFQEGNEILAIPKEDEYKLYQWIDFYKVGVDNKVNLNDRLESTRVDKETLGFEKSGWYGPEAQYFLHYLSGERDIKPYQLREFRGRVVRKSTYGSTIYAEVYIGKVGGKRIKISFTPDSSSQLGQEVIIRPIHQPVNDRTLIEGFVKDEDGNERHIFSRQFYKGDLKLYQFEEGKDLISPDEANEELMRFLETKD